MKRIPQTVGRGLVPKLLESVPWHQVSMIWPPVQGMMTWQINSQMADEIRLMYNHRDG